MDPDARAWLERAEEDLDAARFNRGGLRFPHAGIDAKYEDEDAREAIESAEEVVAWTKSRLSRELLAAVRAFQEATGIQRVIVFGSRASGSSGPESDVDLLLVDPRFEGIKSFRRARGLRQHWKLNVPVDILCYTPAEFEALRKRPTVVREADQRGVEA